jgi:PAS domain S-box-containing protein
MVVTGDTPKFDSASFAPPAHWHEDTSRAHVVQFYSNEASFLDSLSRFVGSALVAGDGAVVIATPVHREGLASRLQAHGLDVEIALQQGRYVEMDAAETLAKFMRNGVPDRERFREVVSRVLSQVWLSAQGEIPRVAAFGEMVALLWAEGNSEAAIRLEQIWNDLAKTHSFSLRCAYPMKGFSREEHGEGFLKICCEHTAVIPGEQYTELASDDERLRNISHLQQKAEQLEDEKARRIDAQKSLRRREMELADFVENALEGVERIGGNRRILWANKALLSLLGYSREEYLYHEAADFHVDRHAFDEFWRKLMRHEAIYNFPAELKCKHDSTKHVLIHANGLWEDGRFVHARCFVRDVTEKKGMEEALRENESRLRRAKAELEFLVEERTTALRRLSSQLLHLQDTERRRIARELHDSLGQYLAGLKLNIALLRKVPESAELWSQSEELTQQCIAEIRTLSYLLHPPMMDEVGLASAAQWYVDGFSRRSGIKVHLDVRQLPTRLSEEIEIVLFRAIQEALTNVHRHSGASTVNIHIHRSSKRVILDVSDNGSGMSAELLDHFNRGGMGAGVGLAGMRERIRELGGELRLGSNKPGASLRIVIPLSNPSHCRWQPQLRVLDL